MLCGVFSLLQSESLGCQQSPVRRDVCDAQPPNLRFWSATRVPGPGDRPRWGKQPNLEVTTRDSSLKDPGNHPSSNA